jgi:adenylosuccinate lyase
MRNSIQQYASEVMRHTWSPEYRIAVEREIWISVMQLQAEAGVDIPQDAILDYIQASDHVDLDRIREIEKEVKHDLRARLIHFNEVAGHSYAHYGLTSCDVTDNAVQDLIRESAGHLDTQAHTLLGRLRDHIEASADLVCVARTHNQPAQLTTVGKRFATVADELLACLGRLQFETKALACRGLVGAVGTGLDLATVLGSAEKYRRVNLEFAQRSGYACMMGSTGQVSHRSEDTAVAAAAVSLTAACANLARMVRLETGYDRMWEIQTEAQVGSSAMPHKRNSITAERVNGLANIAKGYYSMLSSTTGETWLEGDVSDS